MIQKEEFNLTNLMRDSFSCLSTPIYINAGGVTTAEVNLTTMTFANFKDRLKVIFCIFRNKKCS